MFYLNCWLALAGKKTGSVVGTDSQPVVDAECGCRNPEHLEFFAGRQSDEVSRDVSIYRR